MTIPPSFPDAKTAHEAGYKFFIGLTVCKYGHEEKLRRVVPQKGSYTSKCVSCENQAKTKYLANPTSQKKALQAKQNWKLKNKDKTANWRKKVSETNPFYHQLASVRQRCQRNDIAFDLDEDYLESIIPEGYICPILLVQMVHGTKGTDKRNWISIDRIKPDKGYVRGNVALISHYANSLKRDCVAPEVFDRLANYIRNTW